MADEAKTTPAVSGQEQQKETPTPAQSGQDAPTPASSQTQNTTPEASGQEPFKTFQSKEDFEKAFQDRLKRQREKLEQEFSDKSKLEAERAAMSEQEKLAAEKKELEDKLSGTSSEFEAYKSDVELERSMRGKVSDERLALPIAKNYLDDASNIDYEKMFADYPTLKPQDASPTEQRVNAPNVRSSTPKELSQAEIAAMSTEEYAKRRDEIHAAMKAGQIKN